MISSRLLGSVAGLDQLDLIDDYSANQVRPTFGQLDLADDFGSTCIWCDDFGHFLVSFDSVEIS